MPPMVRTAVLLMVAAFVLYTTGVWGVVFSRRLQSWHAGLFWAGFLCDTLGTEFMRRLAGGFHWSLHTATGVAALSLMFIHAVWATLVLIRHRTAAQQRFHRVSIAVWALWLVPFITGLVLGSRRG